MRRREVIGLLGGAAVARAVSARAQQPQEMRRVATLIALPENDPEVKGWIRAFDEELQRLGWEQGRNIQVEHRLSGNDPARLRSEAGDLMAMKPEVLFAAGTPALAALARETRSVPIVFVQVGDPVELGFVISLARPDANITGFVPRESAFGGKWLELLKDTAPGRTRVTVLVDPNNASHAPYFQSIQAAAPSFGVDLIRADVANAADIETAITTLAQQPNGALVVTPGGVTILHRDLIITLAARHRLPAVYPYRFFATHGGFISYGVDLVDSYQQAASYVSRILKGAKVSDLPVQLPSKFQLVVNLKTARSLGLTIPEPFLQRADEVIE